MDNKCYISYPSDPIFLKLFVATINVVGTSDSVMGVLSGEKRCRPSHYTSDNFQSGKAWLEIPACPQIFSQIRMEPIQFVSPDVWRFMFLVCHLYVPPILWLFYSWYDTTGSNPHLERGGSPGAELFRLPNFPMWILILNALTSFKTSTVADTPFLTFGFPVLMSPVIIWQLIGNSSERSIRLDYHRRLLTYFQLLVVHGKYPRLIIP